MATQEQITGIYPAAPSVTAAPTTQPITAQDVTAYLAANPGLSDAQIATIANQFNVPASVLSQATNIPIAQIEQRASAAGVPLLTGSVPTPSPTTQPITGEAGQYGYQNNAPVLNANIAKSILGNEFAVKADIGPSNELGWNTNSKYQGEILTGAGLYGIRGTSEEIQKILSAGETFRQLQAQGKVITTTDPETNTVNYSVQTGIDPETGSPTYVNYANLFNTSSDPENFNGAANAAKFQDVTAKLQDAATKLNIPTAGKTSIQLLNEVNAADRRVAVVGRTQGWDPAQTGGVGGQQGAQHAAVVYQQVGDKLVAASPVQTFNFQDPNTTRGFFGDLIGGVAEVISIPPIAMALSAFGAPYIATQLATLVPSLAGNPAALDAISKGLISGVTTGAITGDAEKAIIGALVAGGGSYAVNTGAIGDVLDRIGLGDVRTQFNIPTTAQVSANIPGITGSGVTPGISVSPGGPVTTTPIGNIISDADFIAADAAQLARQGLGTAAIQQNLIAAGVDPVIAASAANLAVTGASTAAISADIGRFESPTTPLFTTPTNVPSGTVGPTPGMLTQPTVPPVPPGIPSGGGGGPSTPTAPSTPTGTPTGVPTGLLTTAANVAGNLLGNTTLQNLVRGGIDYATASRIASDLEAQAGRIQQQAVAAGREAQVPFTPFTVTTGMGTTTLGRTGATMVGTPAYQQLQQSAIQQAQAAVGAINPQQAAQTIFQQAEALQAPTRAREQEALLGGLRQRGLLGFGQNLPTVGGEVRTVNPLMESLLSAQETARANLALQAQQAGTVEAQRQQQLAAGLQSQAQNIDIQQLNQLLRAQGLSQDQISIALRNAEAQRLSTMGGLQYSTPLLTSAANIRTGQTAQLGTQAQNLFGNLFSQAIPSTALSPLGQGTGAQYGYQDYGLFV